MNEARIEGGLFGLLIGDAVGVPYEFHSANSVPPMPMIDLVPPLPERRREGLVISRTRLSIRDR